MGVIGITKHGTRAGTVEYHRQRLLPRHHESEMWDYNDRVWGEILSTEQKRYGKGELMAEWVEGSQ